jgi:hypothetical protein
MVRVGGPVVREWVVSLVMQQKDLGRLLKWAQRADRFERFVKLLTARFIVKERRVVCLVVGCRNRDRTTPCTRCGATGQPA